MDRRVAALELVVSDEPTTRWELAVAGDQDVARSARTTTSGTGSTPAPAPSPTRRRWPFWRMGRGPGRGGLHPDRLPASPVPGLITAVLDEATGANVVTVATGWGDGCYGTWIGRAADGRVSHRS